MSSSAARRRSYFLKAALAYVAGTSALLAPGATVAFAQEAPPAVSASPDGAAPQVKRRRSLAVVSVRELQESGGAGTSIGLGDAVLFSKAEEVITKSRAYRLVGRDTFQEQMKELKLADDGFVQASDAKQLGGLIGADRLLTVFLVGATRERVLVDADSDLSSLFSKKKENRGGDRKVTKIKGTVTIMCRFTDVETGARETLSYTGSAMGDPGNDSKVMSDAVLGAFEAFQGDLWKKREPFQGAVVSANEEFLRINLGEKDGITRDMVFEIFQQTTESDGYVDRKKIGEAKVFDVQESTAKLIFGESKPKRGAFGVVTGREWKDDREKHRSVKVTRDSKSVFECREKN